jgi:hypothetical protein
MGSNGSGLYCSANMKKDTIERIKSVNILLFNDRNKLALQMRWEADPKSNLKAYEICFPPYEDGRYENIK